MMFLLIATTCSAADGIVWRADYPSGRKEASEAGKAICLVVGSDNCFYCRKLEASTLIDSVVSTTLKKDYVCIKLDGTKEADIVKALNIQMYPTTVLADADGNIHAILKGYVAAEPMREHLRTTVAAIEKANSATAAVKQWRPQALLEVAKQLHDAGRYADALDVAEEVNRFHATGPEAKLAATLVADIRNDAKKLQVAARQTDEKAAALQLALGELHLKTGDSIAAKACFEHVVKLTPTGANADAALVGLAKLKGPLIATPATLKK